MSLTDHCLCEIQGSRRKHLHTLETVHKTLPGGGEGENFEWAPRFCHFLGVHPDFANLLRGGADLVKY